VFPVHTSSILHFAMLVLEQNWVWWGDFSN
jgi:hypothetical protein